MVVSIRRVPSLLLFHSLHSLAGSMSDFINEYLMLIFSQLWSAGLLNLINLWHFLISLVLPCRRECAYHRQ